MEASSAHVLPLICKAMEINAAHAARRQQDARLMILSAQTQSFLRGRLWKLRADTCASTYDKVMTVIGKKEKHTHTHTQRCQTI